MAMKERKNGSDVKLHQCPCCIATKCIMDEPCLGCEVYGEWCNLREHSIPKKEAKQ